MGNSVFRVFACVLALILSAASPTWAIDWDFKGSLGEGEHTHYVPPASNPVLNETPFITTEARLLYLYNSIPGNFPLPGLGSAGGGNINLWALQLRVALTDRLGFIANKDGFVDVNLNVPGLSDDGFANLAFGLKYAVVSDKEKNALVTVGMTYEPSSGNLKAGNFWLQGNGGGFLNPFVTAAKSYGNLGIQTMLGSKIALNRSKNGSLFLASLHVDYEVVKNLFPLMEINLFDPISEANETPFLWEGLDLVSSGGASTDAVATVAFGSRYKIFNNLMAGLVYETPMTRDKDIMKWRLTADLVWNF